ncbi:MAG: four helix bundle protein, partial [Candidatus Peregrinibacteria bacterium]|nr:four helix bundle protein [Candidatus Peregrinibacteria bacterium]
MEFKKDIIEEKSFNFSVRIVSLYKFLKEKNEYTLGKQILRSGTSIGANIKESKGGLSRADFSAKLSIAYKESLETQYWLELLYKTDYIEEELFKSLFEDCVELSKIIFSSVK